MRSFLLAGAALACLCATIAAQTISGTIIGRVTDPTVAVVPNATITARSEQTDLTREAVTNQEGYYSLTFLPVGPYELTVGLKGFQRQVKTGVAVDLNQNTVSNFTLKPSPVAESIV